MATYLFTWDPETTEWSRLPYLLHLSTQGWPVLHDWCCGNSTSIRDGSRFFLVKRGLPPTGIMASGTIISRKPYRRITAKKGTSPGTTDENALFVDLAFDVLLDPDSDPLLATARMKQDGAGRVDWQKRRSGSRLPDVAARNLERSWQNHVAKVRGSA
jgi:hypothetical protein